MSETNKSRKLPDRITREQAQALLAVPNVNCPTGLRNRVALGLMYDAGLRVSEVVKLKPGHIDWQQGQLEIKQAKGEVERVVPVPLETMDWLARWKVARPKASGRFFTTLKGKPLSVRYLQQVVGRCAEKAGIQETEQRWTKEKIDEDTGQVISRSRPYLWHKVHAHTLRHAYASERLAEGLTLAEVRDLLGHSNVKITSRYLHADPIALREKIQGKVAPGNNKVQRLAKALADLSDEQREALAKALERRQNNDTDNTQ